MVSCGRNGGGLRRPPARDKVVSDEADMTGGLSEARATQQHT